MGSSNITNGYEMHGGHQMEVVHVSWTQRKRVATREIGRKPVQWIDQGYHPGSVTKYRFPATNSSIFSLEFESDLTPWDFFLQKSADFKARPAYPRAGLKAKLSVSDWMGRILNSDARCFSSLQLASGKFGLLSCASNIIIQICMDMHI